MPNNQQQGYVNGFWFNPQWAANWPQQPAPGQMIPVANPEQVMAYYNYPPIAQQQAAVEVFVAEPEPVPVVAEDLPAEEGVMVNDFKVGCDPEFMLLGKDGKTVSADRYFGHAGEIGYDHGGRVAEFRPAPTKGVLPIVKRIQALVEKAAKTSPNTRFRAGAICNHDCLGGHVHFGFDCFKIKPQNGYDAGRGGGEFNPRGLQVTQALDSLTKVLEHLDILPGNESAQRRASAQGQGNNYGAYSAVRDCHGHMEYRTMASWLYDPKVAFLCLTAAKLAAADPVGTKEALSKCCTFTGLRKWVEQYGSKDVNAARVSEKLLGGGLKALQVDPEVDFKERWTELGL